MGAHKVEEIVMGSAAPEHVLERLRAAALAAGLCAYEWEVATARFTVNDCGGFFGPDAGVVEMTRHSWAALVHPDDHQKAVTADQLHRRDRGRAIGIEYRLRTCAGPYRWVLDRSRVTEWSDGGRPKTIRGILIELGGDAVSDGDLEDSRRVTAAALRRSEDEKYAILHALRGLVNIRHLDPELRVVWENVRDAEEPHPSLSTPGREYCYQVIHGRTEPCTGVCTPKDALVTGLMMKREAKLADGRRFVERSNPILDEKGEVRGVIFATLNITKQKKVEEEYETTQNILYSFLENLPAPITVYRRDGTIDIVNSAWENLTGKDREDAIGRHCTDVYSNEVAKHICSHNEDVLTTGAPIRLEETVIYPSGNYDFHTVKFPIPVVEGGPTFIGTVSVDITGRKLAEKELEQRRNELLEKSKELEESNTALRVLLKQRDEEQILLGERVVSNVQQLILPYLNRLRDANLTQQQAIYVDIAENHLQDIISPFLKQITTKYKSMTAREMHMATLIKAGMTNKDIAKIMNISVNTVQVHRQNLRKKLGLGGNRGNLQTFLLSLA